MPQKTPPDSRLHIDQTLPLRWEVLAAIPSLAEQRAWYRQSEKVIQGLNLLEEGQRPERREEDGELLQELNRLDLKLSLVLELVAQIAGRGAEPPLAVPVSLASEALRWKTAAAAPSVGQHLLLELFLSDAFPMPLRLPGVVQALTHEAGETLVEAAFLPLPESLREGLEKFIFRRHRRGIAESRHSS